MKNWIFLLGVFFISNQCVKAQAFDVKYKSSGLGICFFSEHKLSRKIKKGDFVLYQLVLKNDLDSVVIDTKKEFGEQQLEIVKSEFRGDLMEGLKQCNEGDSVLFLISTNKLYKKNIPFFAHKNTYMKFYFKINHVFNKSELQQHQLQLFNKQIIYDDSVLNNLFTHSKNIPQRIKPGLYIDLKEKGISGDLRKGDSIKVNYTGRLINNEVFDSNTDLRYGHVEPFALVVGMGNVIKGWDECLTFMQKGGKAVFYISSPYAYGSKKMGNIPSNSILLFDVEVLKR